MIYLLVNGFVMSVNLNHLRYTLVFVEMDLLARGGGLLNSSIFNEKKILERSE